MQHPFSLAGYRYWVRDCLGEAVLGVSVVGIIDAPSTQSEFHRFLEVKTISALLEVYTL
jgi:hypothetical protein